MKRHWVWGVVGALVLGGGTYVYLRTGQKPLAGGLRERPSDRMNPEPPAWLPMKLSHPCETCGTCEHELDLRRHHYELTLKRREKRLFGSEDVQYYFTDLESFEKARGNAETHSAGGRIFLAGRYLSPRHKHPCGGEDFAMAFDVRYHLDVEVIKEWPSYPRPFFPYQRSGLDRLMWFSDGVLPTYGCECGK